MKILVVITKAEIGGAQVFVLNLVRSLKTHGHEVEVAAGDGDYLVEELKKINVPFHYLNSLKRNVSILNTIYFMFDFFRLLKSRKYDVVHLNSSNTLAGALSVRLLPNRPKILFTFHGLSFLDSNYNANHIIKYLARLYFKIFLISVDRTVFVSQLNYNESIKAGIVKDGDVVLNGLDENNMHFLEREDARKYFAKICGQDFSKSFIIGSAGRLAYQKNYEFLVNSFRKIKAKFPNIKIIIMGDGPDHKKLSEKIIHNNIQNDFHLVGAIKDSYKYIKAFDIFTLPSRYEGLSISLIEGIFSNVPVLASDVGGNSEIVGADSPQLFKLDDEEDYIDKLSILIEKADEIYEANKKLQTKFSLNTMTEGYLKIYHSMLKEG